MRPVPVQMWVMSLVPVQMWQGSAPSPLHTQQARTALRRCRRRPILNSYAEALALLRSGAAAGHTAAAGMASPRARCAIGALVLEDWLVR